MNKLEMFSEKLGKTITIIAESVEGQKTSVEGQKSFKPAMEGASNSTVSMMGWCRGGWNNDSGSGW